MSTDAGGNPNWFNSNETESNAMQSAAANMVNGRPIGVCIENESPKREKIEENMLKNKALYFPKTRIVAAKIENSVPAERQASARKVVAKAMDKDQSNEFIDIFGITGRLSIWLTRTWFICQRARNRQGNAGATGKKMRYGPCAGNAVESPAGGACPDRTLQLAKNAEHLCSAALAQLEKFRRIRLKVSEGTREV